MLTGTSAITILFRYNMPVAESAKIPTARFQKQSTFFIVIENSPQRRNSGTTIICTME